jgi:hypothetical protein
MCFKQHFPTKNWSFYRKQTVLSVRYELDLYIQCTIICLQRVNNSPKELI